MADTKRISNEERPLSPHLSIYRPQITSILSICHRISGFALFFGVLVIAWFITLNVYGQSEYINHCLASTLGQYAIGLWSLALYYHLLNGIRHLFWDAGYGYEMTTVNISGVAVLFGSILLTAITWLLALKYIVI